MGGLRRGTKSIQVKKPQFSEAFPEAVIRDGADELTLRAEEVGLLRTFVDTKHVELERWMRTDTPSFSTITTKSLHEAAGTKKPGDSQESFGQRKRQGAGTLNFTIQRIRNTYKAEPESLELWEEHLKSLVAVLAKSLECLDAVYDCSNMSSQILCSCFTGPLLVSRSSWMAAKVVGAIILQKAWEGPCWEGVWPFLDPTDVVGLRTTASVWNVPGEYVPHGELFFFHIKKEPFVLTKAVELRPCVTVETLKACALIGFAYDRRRSYFLVLQCHFSRVGRRVEVCRSNVSRTSTGDGCLFLLAT